MRDKKIYHLDHRRGIFVVILTSPPSFVRSSHNEVVKECNLSLEPKRAKDCEQQLNINSILHFVFILCVVLLN